MDDSEIKLNCKYSSLPNVVRLREFKVENNCSKKEKRTMKTRKNIKVFMD